MSIYLLITIKSSILIIMIAKIIDGNKIAKKILLQVSKKIKNRIILGKKIPGLAVILIGNDIASKIYVKNKCLVCKKVGFNSYLYNFHVSVKEKKIIKLIQELNYNNKIDGILIQLPLPKNIDYKNILENILPTKDVDGFHPYNMGRLCLRIPTFRPCTPKGIITLLQYYKINTYGMHALVVGASNIVGRPMSMELLLIGCTITVAHRFTKNLKKYIKQADLLIVAIGKAEFIPGHWIKKGAIVFDVGINRVSSHKIVGDILFKSALKKASYITPVPGGVGPMTVAMLIKNTLKACEINHN